MKIAVFSDTHGDVSEIRLIEKDLPPLDAVFHLGDYSSDGEQIGKYLGVPCYAVRGNCDYATGNGVPYERVVELGGARFFLTHGHRYRGTYELGLAAEEANCGTVLFGHTHEPLLTAFGPVLIVNPGSLSRPRGRSDAGYAVLTVENGDVSVRLISV
ncbi:MAG: metallophosphoesterase [Clostridia bacterium]|nr:metallophosphoesterase [Clostridia bacterium]